MATARRARGQIRERGARLWANLHCGSARCWAALRRLRARAVRVGGGAARIGRVLRDAAARGCSGVLVRLACWCTAVCSVLCCVFCCGGCAVLGAVPWGARTECWVWWSERSVSRWYSARDAECSGGSGAEHGQAGGARGFGLQNIQVTGKRWPMADGGARGRCLTLRAPCGASGTRYVSMRGLIGSRRVPPT